MHAKDVEISRVMMQAAMRQWPVVKTLIVTLVTYHCNQHFHTLGIVKSVLTVSSIWYDTYLDNLYTSSNDYFCDDDEPLWQCLYTIN